jgi:Cysteine-rich secretory protein family
MKVKELLLPTEANDHTPHLLQRTAMVGMFVMIMLSFAAVNAQTLFWQSSQWLVGTVLPAVVVDLTNAERIELSAPLLSRSAKLDEAARLKAEHMAKNEYFAHHSPDGVSPWYWFEQVAYRYAHAGENLAIHFKDSDAVIAAWMDSPTHRANIANSKYTEIGVGTAKGSFEGHQTVFVVQLFGTPAVPLVATPAPVVVEAVAATPEPEVLATEPVPPEVAGEQDSVTLLVDSAQVYPSEATLTEEALPPPPELVALNTETTRETIYSEHYATSSGFQPLLPAAINKEVNPVSVSALDSIATKPNAVLQIVYLTLGMLMSLLLLVSIVLGFYNARPLQVVYGVGLLLLMSGLFYIHASLSTTVVVATAPTYPSSL